MASNTGHADYLASRLREADPERYLSVLYAPADKRDALLSLYAFNVEIAHIRDAAREPMAGDIRLQWWREALSGERRGEAVGNPVSAALVETMERYELPGAALDRYFEARQHDLYDDMFPDRNSLEGYCGETAGTIIQLAAMVLDSDAARHASTAAGHAACAQTIAGLLGSVAVHRARGQCYVPADVLAQSGTTREAFLGGTDGAGAQAALERMTMLGREHFGRFEQAVRDLPKALMPAFLPLASVPARFARIEKAGQAAMERVIDITPFRRNWSILWRALRGF